MDEYALDEIIEEIERQAEEVNVPDGYRLQLAYRLILVPEEWEEQPGKYDTIH